MNEANDEVVLSTVQCNPAVVQRFLSNKKKTGSSGTRLLGGRCGREPPWGRGTGFTSSLVVYVHRGILPVKKKAWQAIIDACPSR